MVLRWPDRESKDEQDAEENDEPSKGPVVLLSPSDEHGLARYDRYDERSLIENRLNRDGKQYFGLGASLARNKAALLSATVFSTVALMVHRGLQVHEDRIVEKLEDGVDLRGEALGVLRYRRQMEMKNRGTVIIVIGQRLRLTAPAGAGEVRGAGREAGTRHLSVPSPTSVAPREP